MARPKTRLPDADAILALADDAGLLRLKVMPSARQNAVTLPDAPDGTLLVRVSAAPENGKANAAVIALLARALGCSKSRLELVRGETAREKTIRITAP